MKLIIKVLTIVMILVGSVGVMTCHADTWDAYTDFSVTNGNPNGAWSYGSIPNVNSGYVFTPFAVGGTSPAATDAFPATFAGLEYWFHSWLIPFVSRNPTGVNMVDPGWGVYPANCLIMHPTVAPPMAATTAVTVRWTSPGNMPITIEGEYFSVVYATCDVHVMKNGVALWDGIVATNSISFSLSTSVATNDTIDFVLGANGNQDSDLTGFNASITGIPLAESGWVSGEITNDESGLPIKGAKVSAVGSTQSTLTDSTGAYSLMLPTGDYVINVEARKFEVSTTLVTIVADQTVTKDFALTPRAAVTYYVKPATEGGSDSNTGLSLDQAWASIDNGDILGIVGRGDTVRVQPGTYAVRELRDSTTEYAGADIRCGGMAGYPVTYVADNTDTAKVVIDGSAWFGGYTYGMLVKSDYVIIDGFETGYCYVGVAFLAADAKNNEVKNCLFHDPVAGPNAISGGVFDIYGGSNSIHNNVVYADPALMESIGSRGVYSAASTGSTIYNNTLVGCDYGVVLYQTSNIRVFNNIFADSYIAGIASPPGQPHGYNLFHGNTKDYVEGATAAEGEFVADPLFVDATNRDYNLQSGSPAINNGIDVGISFNGPAPDIGAFETSSTTLPTGIQGTVTVFGEPFAGATISTSEASALTTADGTYFLPHPPGDYTVEAGTAGFITESALVSVPLTGSVTQDFVLTPAPGITYYVKPAADGGSDANSGLSLDEAWESIDNGDTLGKLNPGDVVEVQPGVYDIVFHPSAPVLKSSAWLRTSGIKYNPITYKGIVIDGNRPVLDGKYVDGITCGIAIGAAYVVVDGFEVQGFGQGIAVFGPAGGLGAGSNAVIKNCIVHDINSGPGNAGGLSVGLEQRLGTSDVSFINNIVYDSKPGATLIYSELGDKVKIYNNTFVGSDVCSYLTTNMEFANNIVAYSYREGARLYAAAGNQYHHNLYYANALPNMGGMGTGVGEFHANPMFVNRSANDFSLQSTSWAINAGVDLGLPFIGGAPDLGALESQYTSGPALGDPYDTLSDVKSLADGTLVALAGDYAVTAASGTFSDGKCYIEQVNRAAGIKIALDSGLLVNRGDRVKVTGTVQTDANGEKYISVVALTRSGGAPLAPLGMVNRVAAGADVKSLLARVWGKVKSKAVDGSYVVIDDGSGVDIVVMLSGLAKPITLTINETDCIGVTGLVSVYNDGGTAYSAVYPRGDTDIRVF